MEDSRFQNIIYAALDGKFHGLRLERGDDTHDALLRFFRTLSADEQRAFAEAAAEILIEIPPYPENAAKFVTLLFVVQIAKSKKSRVAVRKLLSDGVLEQFVAEQVSLRTHLLITAAKYGVDPWLVDFVFRTAPFSGDLEYKLNCLRVLSWTPDTSCTDFLSLVVPAITEASSKMLARILEGCMERLGCRAFLRWLPSFSDASSSTHGRELGILKSSLLLAAQRRPEDAYATLLGFELEAEGRQVRAEEIVFVASLPPRADTGEIEALLARIRRYPRNRWDLITENNPMARRYRELPVLTCGATKYTLDQRREEDMILLLDRALTASLGRKDDAARDGDLADTIDTLSKPIRQA